MAGLQSIFPNQIYATSYGTCKVIKYINNRKIKVQFEDTGSIVIVDSSNLRKGSIKDPYKPSVYGIGYLGQGLYNTSHPLYKLWVSLFQRCYDPKWHSRQPAYAKCTVVSSWHNFQIFCKWAVLQPNWGRKNFDLDKDIMIKGNRKYGPSYCCFVPTIINRTISRLSSASGYSLNRGKYVARIVINGRMKYLGSFDSKVKAKQCYRRHAKERLRILANRYQSDLSKEIYSRILDWM